MASPGMVGEARSSNTGLSSYSVVGSGVDTLVLAVRVAMDPRAIKRIDEARAAELASASASEREPEPVSLSWLSFAREPLMVLPRGRRSWSYVLHNELVDVEVGRGGVSQTFAMIRLSSQYLWSVPLDVACVVALAFVHDYFGEGATEAVIVSSVDLARDVAGKDVAAEWSDIKAHLVKRAVQVHGVEKHGKLETVQIGCRSGAISAVLYNKLVELRKSHKYWFLDIWRRNGWDGESPVWRVEFRCRRDFLRQAAINTVYDLMERVSGIWTYCAGDWLRHVDAGVDTNVSRMHVSLWWSVYASTFDEGDTSAVTREAKRSADAAALLAQAAGCLESVAAICEVVEESGVLALVVERFRELASMDGLGFDARIERRKRRYVGAA